MTKELEEEKILSASQATIYEVVISLSKQNGDRHYKSIFYTLPTLDVHNFYQQSDTGNLYTGPRKNCPDWGTAPREIHGKSKRCRSSQNSHETTGLPDNLSCQLLMLRLSERRTHFQGKLLGKELSGDNNDSGVL